MSRFGELAPCRSCGGLGKVKLYVPLKVDPSRMAWRTRECPECGGGGYLPPRLVDRRDDGRHDRRRP